MKKTNIGKTLNSIKEISKKKLDGSITIRVNNLTKEKFEKVCSDMGLSISSAISSFITKVVNVGAIPFNVSLRKKKRMLGIANGKYNIDYNEFNQLDEEIINMFGV